MSKNDKLMKLMTTNFDTLTNEEIKLLIKEGLITEQDVVDFYGNEWWADMP